MEKNMEIKETERNIQNAALEYLNALPHCFAWRQNSGLIGIETKGKTRYFRAGIKGVSDILGIYKGQFLAVEIKKKGAKPRQHQLDFIQRINDLGGIAFWVDSIDEIMLKIK